MTDGSGEGIGVVGVTLTNSSTGGCEGSDVVGFSLVGWGVSGASLGNNEVGGEVASATGSNVSTASITGDGDGSAVFSTSD